jgi:hypothetical protein
MYNTSALMDGTDFNESVMSWESSATNREGRKGRGITIKWTNNRDGKEMKTKEETEIKRKNGVGGGGGLSDINI